MRADRFARNADGCLLRAKGANSYAEKAALLQLAQSWLQLAGAARVTMGNVACLFEVSGMNEDDSPRDDPESPRSQISPAA
jgi:hypothetical protein